MCYHSNRQGANRLDTIPLGRKAMDQMTLLVVVGGLSQYFRFRSRVGMGEPVLELSRRPLDPPDIMTITQSGRRACVRSLESAVHREIADTVNRDLRRQISVPVLPAYGADPCLVKVQSLRSLLGPWQTSAVAARRPTYYVSARSYRRQRT